MAKHRRRWNQSVYEKYITEGRGQGEGQEYKPWIRVQDFASRGIVSRVYSHKTGRVHHLLSNNELHYFYLAEWSEKVIDIREQFPLSDLETAMNVAASAGIAYPTDNVSGFPYVMTCDFVLTTTGGLKARTIKQVSELANTRVIEKLEIERRYWERLGVDWKLVTDRDIDTPKARAIEWARQNGNGTSICKDGSVLAEAVKRFETNESTIDAAGSLEYDFHYPKGVGLLILKQLIQTKQISADKPLFVGSVDLGVLSRATREQI